MRLSAVLILTLISLSAACTGLVTPPPSGTPPSPDLEATVRAVVADVQSGPQPAGASDGDLEATITASVQATVQALRSATPVPSPTPTFRAAARAVAPSVEPAATQAPTAQPSPTSTVPPTPTPTAAPFPSTTPVAVCSPPPDGTLVTASVNDEEIASTTMENGRYELFVDSGDGAVLAGQTLTFQIGGQDADQTIVLEIGGATELDLTASGSPGLTLWPGPTGFDHGVSSFGVLAQMLPPHVFVGSASVGC